MVPSGIVVALTSPPSMGISQDWHSPRFQRVRGTPVRTPGSAVISGGPAARREAVRVVLLMCPAASAITIIEPMLEWLPLAMPTDVYTVSNMQAR